MSKVASAISKVSSILSMVLAPINPVLAAAFAVNAAVMGTIAAATAKPPPAKGSLSQVLIGRDLPIPYAIGRTYVGGIQVFDDTNGEKNRWRFQVNVVSAAGPVQSFDQFLLDYSPTTLTGTGAALGWYADFLDCETRAGLRPETAFTSAGTPMPGWTSSHKLSGYAAYRLKMKFDKDGKRFASGVPQMGWVGHWVKVYDPRLDSTYPGGSGAQRWNDEASWAWSENPALHALAYARGRYVEKTAAGAALVPPVRLLGIGLPKAAIDLAMFVSLANLCEANGWTAGGILYEGPGTSKWDNLKRILACAAAEPVWAEGALLLKLSAPRPSLFTITAADLADGSIDIQAMKPWRDRKNSIVPKYRAEDSKWEYVQGDAVTASTYLAEDGELKSEEVQFDLCQDKDQAAQLAGYRLVNMREFGPITLSVKPWLVGFRPGEAGTLNIPDEGLVNQKVVMVARAIDPATGVVTATFESETDAKHAFALARTGTAPPTPTIRSSQELDEAASDIGNAELAALVGNSSARNLDLAIGTTGVVTVSNHERIYADKVVAVTGATVTPTGAVAGDKIGVFYDDPERSGGAVTYQWWRFPGGTGETDQLFASAEHPARHTVCLLTVPSSGTTSGGSGTGSGTGGTGGGIGGGYSGIRPPDEV